MAESGEPTYSDLSHAERAWVEDQLAAAARSGAHTSDLPSVDRLFGEALAGVRDGSVRPETGNDVVNQVAALVGEHLCRTAGMQWAIVTDEYGTDLCVRQPGSTLLFFPQSSAAKRWESGEVGWVQPFCAWAHGQVARPVDPRAG